MTTAADTAEAACPDGWTLTYRELPNVCRPDSRGTLRSRGVAAVRWVDGFDFRTRVLGQEVWHGGRWWFSPVLDAGGRIGWPAALLDVLGTPCWCLGSGLDADRVPCAVDGCRAGAVRRAKLRQDGA